MGLIQIALSFLLEGNSAGVVNSRWVTTGLLFDISLTIRPTVNQLFNLMNFGAIHKVF
jgi:hypothetical protein